MATEQPIENLDQLKAELLSQFAEASSAARGFSVSQEAKAANRNACGTIALALVALEKEQREAGGERSKFSMPGK